MLNILNTILSTDGLRIHRRIMTMTYSITTLQQNTNNLVIAKKNAPPLVSL